MHLPVLKPTIHGFWGISTIRTVLCYAIWSNMLMGKYHPGNRTGNCAKEFVFKSRVGYKMDIPPQQRMTETSI